MKVAYVDTSVLLAVALDEPGAEAAKRALAGFDRLYTSGLTEAEYGARMRREGLPTDFPAETGVGFLGLPARLDGEVGRVLAAGYARGADTWHVAAALWLDPAAGDVVFATLDAKQAVVAAAVGFSVVP